MCGKVPSSQPVTKTTGNSRPFAVCRVIRVTTPVSTGPPSDAAASDGGPVDTGVVTLMTLHTAKGLEFPVVFVTGWEDGTFPHMRSLSDPDQLAEERRLAYVGLTRAQKRLYISRAAVRTAWGVPNEFPASRFLDDVPEELVDWRRRESSMAALRAAGTGWGGGASAWGRPTARSSTPGAGGRGPGGSARTGAVKAPRDAAPHLGSATPRAAGDVPNLALGDKVTHDSYGLGVVVGIEGGGANAVAKIDFGTDGTKRLLLRYSPVTKL